MIFDKNSKLEEMKKRHDFDVKVMKLKGEHQREKNKIKNDIQHEALEAEEKELGKLENIRVLKTKVKRDKNTIKSGRALLLWGTLTTIISALLTICGLWNYFNTNTIKLVSFIAVILLTQFTVFILSKQISVIYVSYKQHFIKAQLLRYCLLVVSVYGNFIFFTSDRKIGIIEGLVTIALCIAIDTIAIFCVAIGQDLKNLNTCTVIERNYKFIEKLYNVVAEKLQDNKLRKIAVQGQKQIEKKDSNVFQEKNTAINLGNERVLLQVKNAILKNKTGDRSPSMAELEKITGLAKNDIAAAKRELEKRDIIETKGTTTYIK